LDSTDSHDELQWTCSVFRDILYRCWEDEYFLFNPNTGHTHVLNHFSWDILSKCAEQPCSESALLDLVSAGNSTEDLESLVESLDIHLDHLAQLGFLETVEIHALH